MFLLVRVLLTDAELVMSGKIKSGLSSYLNEYREHLLELCSVRVPRKKSRHL